MPVFLRNLSKFLTGIVTFGFFVVLGWGLDDIPGYFAHPARLLYIAAVILLSAVSVIRYPWLGTGRGKGKTFIVRQHWAILLIQIFSIAAVISSPYSDRRNFLVFDGSDVMRYCGFTVFVLGFQMMVWAEVTLGRFFSTEVTIQEGHRLVTSGVYHYLRHPRYLGVILFTVGISVLFRSWLGLISTMLLGLVLLWRIADEEKLLHMEFGAEWENYSKRSKRLIPFLY